MTPLSQIQKSRLAKLLGQPGIVEYKSRPGQFFWLGDVEDEVTDREWPYVCERIKEEMSPVESDQFIFFLDKNKGHKNRLEISPIRYLFSSLSEVADALWQTLGKEEV